MLLRNAYVKTLIASLSFFSAIPLASAAGINFGVDVGRAEAKKYCDNIDKCSSADLSLKADVGYEFNEMFSAELGYVSFGTLFSATNSTVAAEQKSRAVTISGVGAFPFTPQFGAYGRLGMAWYNTNGSGTVAGVPVSDKSGGAPFFGAGLKFDVTPQIAVRGEFQVYSNISNVDGNKDNVQAMYVGVVYRM